MTERPTRLFTIGHSDRTLDSLIYLLESSSIKMVADVRSNPASGRFPHFDRVSLASALDDRGISYRWFRSLGGRRDPSVEDDEHTALPAEIRSYACYLNTETVQSAVEDLVGLGASAVTAILCAEKDPKFCHRNLLADKLYILGVRVVHILDSRTAYLHEPHPDLVSDGCRLIYRKKQLQLL